jgi:hypothetical protein
VQILPVFKGKPFNTPPAGAVKNGPPEIHPEALPPGPSPEDFIPHCRKTVKGFGIRAGEIRHPAAKTACHMGMGLDVAVKPFFPVHHPQGNYQPFLSEKNKVPVYRPQRKIGDRRFKLIIDPLGTGMGYRGPDNFQNGVPFFAMLPLDKLHILIIITIIIIVKRFLKKQDKI